MKSPIMLIVYGLLFRDLSYWAIVFVTGSAWIILDIIGFLIIVYALIKTRRVKLDSNINSWFKIYICYTIFMIMRGSIIGNYPLGEPANIMGVIHDLTSSAYSNLGYLMPLVALFPFNLKILHSIKILTLIFAVVSIVLLFQNKDSIIYAQMGMGNHVGYTDVEFEGGLLLRSLIERCFPLFGLTVMMLFCYKYIESRFSLLLPIVTVLYFAGEVIGAGRGMSIIVFGYIMTWFYIMTKLPVSITTRAHFFNERLKRYLAIIAFGAFLYALYYLFNQTDTFDLLFERIFGGSGKASMFEENNRTRMTRDMIQDFNNNPIDWLIGRGINGFYRCTDIDYATNGYRRWMEWGYMYQILKGGIIYLGFYIFFYLHAFYVGFKKSNNYFCKALALVCLWQIVNLATTTSEPSLLSFYVVPWICFGLVERKNIREIDDVTIFNHFNNHIN